MRHNDGGRCAAAVRIGGRVQEALGHFVEKQRGDDMRIKPASSKLTIPGGEPIEVQQALQTLEREFNLPSQAIQRQHALGRVLMLIK
jgi:hypothetical protein